MQCRRKAGIPEGKHMRNTPVHPEMERDELIALRDRMIAIRNTRQKRKTSVKLFVAQLKIHGVSISQGTYYDCERNIHRGVNLIIRNPAFAETAEHILGIDYVG